MYKELRSSGVLSYEAISRKFEAHQGVWPEAIWNEDAYEKYLEPLVHDNDASYLSMLQGDKSSQRDWWLFNGFRYRDSKYHTGDALSNYIMLRAYATGDITVTPYAHICPTIKYGSYDVPGKRPNRVKRNESVTLECPLDEMNDTEIYIYSADRIAEIGDLSGLLVGYADFTRAVKLQKLVLGSNAEGYTNPNLKELYVGNNELLTELNIENCAQLAQAVDLSGCTSIERIYARGSAITGLTLPNGGRLETLELPGTMTNFTIRNQKMLKTAKLEGYSALSTLSIEDTPNLPIEALVNGAPELTRVRLFKVDWTASSEEQLSTMIERLKGCAGLDASGGNTERAVVSGKVRISAISSELLSTINDAFPELVVIVNGVPNYLVRYLNYDGTVLYKAVVGEGDNAIDPVTTGAIETPTREGTETTGFVFKNWDTLPTNIHANCNVVAQYDSAYAIRYVNYDGTVLQTKWIVAGGSTSYTGSTPTRASTAQYSYTFNVWSSGGTSGAVSNISGAQTITATYTATIRTYTVKFYSGSTLLQTVTNVAYGSSATYTGSTPVSPDGTAEEGYTFEGWDPLPSGIQGDTNCYAQFASPVKDVEITDDWDTIRKNVAAGVYKDKYALGNYKSVDLGDEGVINMQIVAIDKDDLADGSGKVPLTWIGKELLKTNKRMNPSRSGNSTDGYTEGTGSIGGWEKTEIRSYLQNTIKPLIPDAARKQIKSVSKNARAFNTSSNAFQQTTQDELWIPSHREIFASSAYDTNGPMYSAIYKDSTSRIKMKVGSTSLGWWWLRSASSTSNFRIVSSGGTNYNDGADYSYGVALGFSTGSDTISDSWDEIIQSIADGTYKTKYSIGDTKVLDLGDQGKVCMQIAAFDADTLSDGTGKAPISWISEQVLITSHRMNPALVGKVDELRFDPSAQYQWAAIEDASNTFKSTNQGKGSTTSLGGWKVTPAASGTLTINWTVDSESANFDYLDVYVNGVAKASKKGGSGRSGSFTVDMVAGTSMNIFASYRKDGSGDQGTDTATVAFTADTNFSVSAITETVVIQEAIPATEGTGAIGGWEKSEMRSYLKNTIKPLIPENVRNAIKTVTKNSVRYNTVEESEQSTTQDDVWIPSNREVFGGTYYETDGVTYSSLFTSNTYRIKQRFGVASAVWWWLRSAYSTSGFRRVSTGGGSSGYGAGSSNGVVLGFCI